MEDEFMIKMHDMEEERLMFWNKEACGIGFLVDESSFFVGDIRL